MKKDKQAGTLEMGMENTVMQLKTNYKKFETHLKNNSFVKQSLSVLEDAVEVAMISVLYGVANGVSLSVCEKLLCTSFPIRPHRVGVMTGIKKGISAIMTKERGKEDLETILVAGFGGGFMSGVVCGENPTEAFADGVIVSLLDGGIFKVEEKLSQQKAAGDALYKTGRSMLEKDGSDHKSLKSRVLRQPLFMKKDKQGTLEMGIENKVMQLKTNYNKIETHFNNSFVKKSLSVVEAAVEVALISAVYGVTSGVTTSVFKELLGPSLPVLNLIRPYKVGVMACVKRGISAVMTKVKGKEDLETTLVAYFGAGFIGGVVCGENPIEVFADGISFSLMGGGIFKMQEKLSQQNAAEDALYKNGRSMLSSLGLDRFENNFKRGLFTDKTLPLLTDSDLQEVKIPPGPRRLILDHIQRDKKVKQED